MNQSGKGFTLIELLVVIAIIGILSAVVLASLNSARLKANDAQTQSNFHSLQTALQLYLATNGTMPPNLGSAADCSVPNASLAPLVTGGFISKIPTSPNANYSYCYYNYGPNNATGAMIGAQLQGQPASTGYAGTCRPFAAGTNWCDQSANTYYCLCNPY